MTTLKERREFLSSGIDRFIFGFALPGETIQHCGNTLQFVGEFDRKKDAKQAAGYLGADVRGYLHGKRKRGWVVIKKIPA